MGNFMERSTPFDCGNMKTGLCWDYSATAEWTRRTNGERCLSINATKLIKRQNVDSSPVRRSLYWTSFYILYFLDIDGYDRRRLLALSSRVAVVHDIK